MITGTILGILGLLLLAVLWMMIRSPGAKAIPAGSAAPPQLAATGDIHPSEARKGDVVSVHGGASDFSDVDFTVDQRGAFDYGGKRWVNLSGEFRGERVYLEAQPRPSTEVMGILDGGRLSLADLQIGEDRLIELDTKQDPNQAVAYGGSNWRYEYSREIGFFENETGAGEGFYRWMFREQNGQRLLLVEKWEGEPFDVRIAREFNTRDITVYRAA